VLEGGNHYLTNLKLKQMQTSDQAGEAKRTLVIEISMVTIKLLQCLERCQFDNENDTLICRRCSGWS
jgi:hypothetical protein